MRYLLFATMVMLMLNSIARADDSGLLFFDPEAEGTLQAAAPEGTVKVTVDFTKPTIRIGGRFYGINIHPLPAEEAFRNPELIKALKPDSIRIMAQKRTFWYRENGQSKSYTRLLSPERGKFNWPVLDDLLEKIEGIGAEPYVAIGFGAPAWLNSSGAERFARPNQADIPQLADFMAQVAAHMKEKNFNVPYITVDNEPENVRYPLEDYILLSKLVSEKVRPENFRIAGPATGYARWPQPDGSNLSFDSSLKKLREAGVRFDAVDWHVYSTTPRTIFRTVDIVKRVYPDTPLFLTELNLDWRYSGEGGEKSRINNTSWNSVRFLAATFDGLQKRGVDRVYYFCLRNRYFGLYDYNMTETHPNYHTFRMFSVQLGRQRVSAGSDHPAVGAVATLGNKGEKALLLYNLSDREVRTAVSGMPDQCRSSAFSQKWYEANKAIRDGKPVLLPEKRTILSEPVTVPAGGLLLLRTP